MKVFKFGGASVKDAAGVKKPLFNCPSTAWTTYRGRFSYGEND